MAENHNVDAIIDSLNDDSYTLIKKKHGPTNNFHLIKNANMLEVNEPSWRKLDVRSSLRTVCKNFWFSNMDELEPYILFTDASTMIRVTRTRMCMTCNNLVVKYPGRYGLTNKYLDTMYDEIIYERNSLYNRL
jgi:hypothetical protein